MERKTKSKFTPAVQVILIFGVISMLGDIIYESARSVNGQYLNLLSISAAKVGLVFGIGEFLGYGLRLLAGIRSDRSGKHWTFMFLGYGMLIVVPMIGLTRNWPILVVLLLMERIGKALRNPPKDTILSSVADGELGIGFAFGLQEALDQLGAFLGPLIFTAVFYFSGAQNVESYQTGYKLLIIPYILLMLFLFFAYKKITNSNLIPELKTKEYRAEKLQPVFWQYTAFTFFSTLGFVSFAIIGYHLKAKSLMTDSQITLLYSMAMVVDAIAALLVGRGYDKVKERTGSKTGGVLVLALVPLITLLLPFFTLSNSTTLIVIGMIIFGIVMGTHETIMRSAIADFTPFYKRGTGYGIFNTAYGLALLIGASLMGKLYDVEMIWLIQVLTVITELIGLFYFNRIRNTTLSAKN